MIPQSHLPAAVIERLDASITTRVVAAVRQAELPPLALGLPADVHEVATRRGSGLSLGKA